MLQKSVHIALRGTVELHTVSLKSCRDRRKHDVRSTEGAEQPRRAALMVAPDLYDTIDIDIHRGGPDRTPPACTCVDGHRRAQRVKCRMDLATQTARASSLPSVIRPHGGILL